MRLGNECLLARFQKRQRVWEGSEGRKRQSWRETEFSGRLAISSEHRVHRRGIEFQEDHANSIFRLHRFPGLPLL